MTESQAVRNSFLRGVQYNGDIDVSFEWKYNISGLSFCKCSILQLRARELYIMTGIIYISNKYDETSPISCDENRLFYT